MTDMGLEIAVFADGASLEAMVSAHRQGLAQGFTTNPTLMAKAGVADYRAFAREVLDAIPDLPISFEVTADELPDMGRQARELSRWVENVYVTVQDLNQRDENE